MGRVHKYVPFLLDLPPIPPPSLFDILLCCRLWLRSTEYIWLYIHMDMYSCHRWHGGNESACQCRRCRRHGFEPWVSKIPWSRNCPLHYSSMESSTDRGACWASVHGVAKSQTQPSMHTCVCQDCHIFCSLFLLSFIWGWVNLFPWIKSVTQPWMWWRKLLFHQHRIYTITGISEK